jgi:protein-tyrosine phosphatase
MEKRKILFVCQGNICRSPLAMFLLRYKLKEIGKDDDFEITSAGLENSTKGEDMHPESKKQLDEHEIPYQEHHAHPLSPKEFLEQDYVLYMENYQKIAIKRMMSNNHIEKLHRLFDYTGECRDIADPYYTGDFVTAYLDIDKALDCFIQKEILKNN